MDDARQMYEKAISHQVRALERNANHPVYLEFLRNHYGQFGEVLAAQRRWVPAKDAYAKELELARRLCSDFNESVAHREALNQVCFLLGKLLVESNLPEVRDPHRAAQLLSDCTQYSPQVPEYWFWRGIAEYHDQQWAEAIVSFGEAQALMPSDSSLILFYLAMARWHVDDRDQAKEHFDRGIRAMEA